MRLLNIDNIKFAKSLAVELLSRGVRRESFRASGFRRRSGLGHAPSERKSARPTDEPGHSDVMLNISLWGL